GGPYTITFQGDLGTRVGLLSSGSSRVSLVPLGDLNADGKPDLVVLHHEFRQNSFITDGEFVDVLLYNTDQGVPVPSFRPANTISVNRQEFLGSAVALGDLDGDGKPDIVTLDS